MAAPLSYIGHGQLGLRSRIRPLKDLIGESNNSRRPFLDFLAGLPFAPGSAVWTKVGTPYTMTLTAASVSVAGVLRAVVAVETMVAPRPLVRVERVADLALGTWFYDDDALVSGGSVTFYIRLPDDTDPEATTVVLHLLFNASTDGEVHPVLSPTKLINGSLDSWASSTTLNNFNGLNIAATGVAISREDTDVFEGTHALRIVPGASGLNPGTSGGANQAPITAVAGGLYLSRAAYQTDPNLHPDLSARLAMRLGPVGDNMLEDGRGQSSANVGLALGSTAGQWNRASYFWRCPIDLTTLVFSLRMHNSGAGAVTGGYVLFDDVALYRIWRFTYYEPILAGGSIPELEIRLQNFLFAQRTIGIGGISLVDGAGALSRGLAGLVTIDKPATVYAGGAFTSGEEVTRDDWAVAFPAHMHEPEYTEGKITIGLEDSMTLAKVPAAQETHRSDDEPKLQLSGRGHVKGVMFGVTQEPIIEMTRVDLSALGYGIYEWVAPDVPTDSASPAPIELATTPTVKSYPSKQLADLDLNGLATTDTTNDFSYGAQNTQLTVKRDLRQVQFNRSGEDVGSRSAFTFEYNANVFTVKIAFAGFSYQAAATLQAAMRAAAAVATINVGYDEGGGANPHKWTVAKVAGVAGTFKLLTQKATAGEPQAPGWEQCGFDIRTDRTGTGATVTFVGDFVTFTDPDKDHVLRVNGGGMKDDPAGSICGTASASLNTPPAIASWLLQKVAGVPASLIDLASFAAARDTCITDFILLFMVLDDPRKDVADALGRLCQVGMMSLNVGADRVWRCKRYAAGTLGARVFYDSDYLAWSMRQDEAAIFKEVRVWGAYHPARREFRTWGDASSIFSTAGMPVRYGTEGIFELFGFLDETVITGGLQNVSVRYGRLIVGVPRVARFSAGGKLADLAIGDKVILNKSGPGHLEVDSSGLVVQVASAPGVFDPGGALVSVAFRIWGLAHNFLTGVSRALGVEDVDIIS